MTTTQFASLAAAIDHVTEHEVKFCVKYVKTNGLFKGLSTPVSEINLKASRLAHMNGVVGVKVSTANLYCQHGRDYKAAKRSSSSQLPEDVNNEDIYKKQRRNIQDSRKLDCPAKVSFARKLVFPDYRCKVARTSGGTESKEQKKEKKSVMSTLKWQIEKGAQLKCVDIYLVTLPNPCDHVNHEVGEENSDYQPIDERIVKKVEYIVNHMHITDTRSVGAHIEEFVKKTLFSGEELPSETNRRFFPTAKTLKNCIDKMIAKNLYLKENIKLNKESRRLAVNTPKRNRTTKLNKIRSMLDELKSWSHLTPSENAIDRVYTGLLNLREETPVTSMYHDSDNLHRTTPAKKRCLMQESSVYVKVKRKSPIKYGAESVIDMNSDYVTETQSACDELTSHQL